MKPSKHRGRDVIGPEFARQILHAMLAGSSQHCQGIIEMVTVCGKAEKTP